MNQILCQWHNLPLSQMILSAEKTELICEECYVNLMENNKMDIEKMIYLKKAIRCPAYVLSKTKIKEDFPDFFQNLQKFEEVELKKQSAQLEQEIRVIQKMLESVIDEIKAQVSLRIQQRQEIIEKLKYIINFEQLQQLIEELGKQCDEINPDIVQQIENRFQQYFNTLQNDNNNNVKGQIKDVIMNQMNSVKEVPELQSPLKLNQFNNLVKQFNDHHSSLFKAIQNQPSYLMGSFQDSRILSKEYNSNLFRLIQQKAKRKIESANPIYLGSRDGLNSNQLWQKIDGKTHLLMIFQSKNKNYVFGGYTPCQWQSTAKVWVQDDSVTSFIFSQTHNQVYPLKQEQRAKAIYCDSAYGPVFGTGNDMYFTKDMQGGGSNIGMTYSQEQYEIVSIHHLFGANTPNVIECEVYEIKFT